MKVIIAGSRNFNDYDLLCRICDEEISSQDEIVSGVAKGADLLGERYAQAKGITVKRFPVTKDDWSKFGKSAGYMRNSSMSEYADALIAFWDGESKGTKHMIDLANKNRLKVRVVNF